MVTHHETSRIGLLEVAVFGAEIALLGAVATAGARFGVGPVAVVLAVLLPVAVALVWGVFLAPRGPRRLPYPVRLAAKLALVLVSGALLAASGAPVWAVVFAVPAAGLFIVGEVRESSQ